MKKKLSFVLALSLAISILFTPAIAYATDNTVLPTETEKVHADSAAVNAIYEKYAAKPVVYDSSNPFCDTPTKEIEDELTHIYIDVTKAKATFEKEPTSINEDNYNKLVERAYNIESELKSRGFLFLTDEEAQIMLGALSPYGGEVGPRPADKEHTIFAASPIQTVTLSNGQSVPYYYVTAIARDQNGNSMCFFREDIDVDTSYIKEIGKATVVNVFWSMGSNLLPGKKLKTVSLALIQGFIGTIPPAAKPSAYKIRPSAVATPRFIFAYSDGYKDYVLEGVSHSTSVRVVHSFLFQANQKPLETQTEYNETIVCKYYNNPSGLVKTQWESMAEKGIIDAVGDYDVELHSDGDIKPSNLFKTITFALPYATSYGDLD